MPNRATPLPQAESFLKSFLTAEGDRDPTNQDDLSKRMGLKYRNGVGELIYALVTCQPDISYAVVKWAQSTIAPHEVHYHALRHILKYLYTTRDDGIYFWRTVRNPHLPSKLHPASLVRQQIYSLLTNLFTMRWKLMDMSTPIGLLAPAPAARSPAFVSNSLGVPLHIKQNCNRPLHNR
jgi:hypothetical protein